MTLNFTRVMYPESSRQCWLLPHVQGRLLSLLDDNTIHLWELVAGAPREVGGEKQEGVVCLQEVGGYTLPGRPGIESCRCVQSLANKFVLPCFSDV